MQVAVDTTGQPQDIASSKQLGTGLIVEVLRKICAEEYCVTKSSIDSAGLDKPSEQLPTNFTSKPQSDSLTCLVILCQPE